MDLLKDIEAIKNGDRKTIMIPARDENIQVMKEWISKNIKSNLWISEYEDFLKIVNGLDFNGLVIYNAQPNDDNNGFIGANEIWRENEWDCNYLFFGDSSISCYCQDVDHYLFVELDKPNGDVVDEYESLDKMFEKGSKAYYKFLEKCTMSRSGAPVLNGTGNYCLIETTDTTC